jgi:hypothetical protein
MGEAAPVRLVELVEYRRYTDAAGLVWLGVRGASAGGWSPSSPVAGPLSPAGGLRLSWSERLFEARLVVRGRLVRRSWGYGPVRDSAIVAVALP